MNIEELRELCLGFPKVTEDIKWVDNLVFSLGGKMFCLIQDSYLHQHPKIFDLPVNSFISLRGAEIKCWLCSKPPCGLLIL